MVCETTLFTGKINSGKTTRILEAVKRIDAAGKSIGGIVSLPLFRNGKKYAYYAYDLITKEAALLTTTEPIENSVRFSRFYFSRSGFRFAEEGIRASTSCDYLVLDEAGPLELQGDGFADIIRYIRGNYRGHFLLAAREQVLEELISRFSFSGSPYRIIFPNQEFTL